MINFLELVKKRYSVRRYTGRPVAREKIERCLEAARLAPSACNAQPWQFIVVDEPELREEVAKTTFGPLAPFNKFSLQAPVLVVVVLEKSNLLAQVGGFLRKKEFNLIDLGIAAEHFSLQAAEEGLGTCILGWFDEKKVRKILGIPSGKRPGLIITLGYPESGEIPEKKRKPLSAFRFYNRYGSG
jgi:nitroreductase